VESLKIVVACIFAAVIYGVVHDQVTARICVEYFTEFHPPVFATQSPTLLALGWRVIATWWAGAMIGTLLAFAARAGSRPKLSFRSIVVWLPLFMAVMGFCAVVSGTIGYFWAPLPHDIADLLPHAMQRRFLAAWWAHGASYLSGFVGGVLLCILVWSRRSRLSA
jgi:ABC-type phosphate/phosphonate transport system permease subunit